jgi:chromosome segregation ATPase
MGQNKTLNAYLPIVFIVFAIVFFASFTFANAEEDISVTNTAVSDVSEIDSDDTTVIKKRVQARPSLINVQKVDAQNDRIEKFTDKIEERKLEIRSHANEEKDGEVRKRGTSTKEEASERKAERAERLSEKATERIEAYVEKITKRLNAALERIEKMIERVESRITKLEEKFVDRGLDLSESKRLLEVARTEVASARADVSAVEGAVEGALNTDAPKESFTAVRELIKSAAASVKSAHAALVAAVKEVKAVVEPLNTDNGDTKDTDDDDDNTDDDDTDDATDTNEDNE